MNERRMRRFSEAISEGDGISVIVPVGGLEEARVAEAEGAEGILVDGAVPGLQEATALPVLWRGGGSIDDALAAGADACLLVFERVADDARLEELSAAALERGLECVVDVRSDEELALALERIDPEIFLLSGRGAGDDEEPLARVLELLPDVPAGKLAIAEAGVSARDEVLALERAGIDAVLVRPGNVAELVGGSAPEG